MIVIGILAVGLTSLMATMGYWFDWVRFAGAAYLVWLGIKLVRSPVEGIGEGEAPAPPRGGFFLQGFVVALSNPKLLVFFGAFIPQFMDMSKDHLSQVLILGVTFMVLAAADRRRLCAARRPRAKNVLGAAHAADVAHLRRLHDRRRHLARADARQTMTRPGEPFAAWRRLKQNCHASKESPCPICHGSSMRCCSRRSG